jgi:hypothetical protein
MPLRVPVCAAMGLSAIVGLAMLDMPFNTLVRYMATDVRSVPLLAIPFFVLAGNMMNQFGMTRRIFNFLEVVVGYFSGGLAQVAVLAAMVFGGISGSALATIAGLGIITVHAMRTAGYRPEFAAALVVAASLMDPLIPPSIMFIIYAVQMNVSIADLFIAGVIPGILLGVLLMANNAVLVKFKIEQAPPAVAPSLERLKTTFLQGFPALLTPIIILRSMTTGLVTPTEASVLAVPLHAVPWRHPSRAHVGAAGCLLRGVHARDRADHVPDRARHGHGLRHDVGTRGRTDGELDGLVHRQPVRRARARGAGAAGHGHLPRSNPVMLIAGAAVRAAGGQLRRRSGPFRRRAHVRDSARDRASADRTGNFRGVRHHAVADGARRARDAPVLSGIRAVSAAADVHPGALDVAAAPAAEALSP